MPKNTFSNATNNDGDYQVINLQVLVNGKQVNLGGLFVSNDKATKISKTIFDLINSGELDASKPEISIRNIFDSATNEDEAVDASAF